MNSQELDTDGDDVESLLTRAYEALDKFQNRTALRLAEECRRRGKASQQFGVYIRGTFTVMNQASTILQVERQRDAAMEIIASLESIDAARRIQADLGDDEFESLRYRFLPCGYDNFARGVASLQGYNSAGLHACIADGIEVCRRTGKSECIRCFHGYACEVYQAADDLPMALHFARTTLREDEPMAARRLWVGIVDEWVIYNLQGNMEAALQALRRAWQARLAYHSPRRAELWTIDYARETLALLGRLDELPEFLGEEPERLVLPEFDPHEAPGPYWDFRTTDATLAACRGDFATALDILEEVDAVMRRQKYLTSWFRYRTQRIATLMLAGRAHEVPPLAEQLRAEAVKARDYLILRRLDRLLDPATCHSPIATVEDMWQGPFSRPRRGGSSASDGSPSVKTASAAETAVAPPVENDASVPTNDADASEARRTPLGEFCGALMRRLFVEEGAPAPDVPAVVREIVDAPPASVVDTEDAMLLLRLLGIAGVQLDDAELLRRAWDWTGLVRASHANDVDVAYQAAVLGSRFLERLTTLGVGPRDWLSATELDEAFRELLERAPHAPPFWAAAGMHFWSTGNSGEAERCFARAFRLDRKFCWAAIQLAQLYRQADRPRDALAALDLCLREGGDDPQVAWDASLVAFGLQNYEATLSYLSRLEELGGETPWSDYYRAYSLLELGRAEESLESARRFVARTPEAPYPGRVLAAAALGRRELSDEFRAAVQEVSREPLRHANTLTTSALVKLHRLLWMSVARLPSGDEVRRAFEVFLFSAGLAPDELFEEERKIAGGEPLEGLDFFRVTLKVTLDEDWSQQPYCRAGEEEWTEYEIYWGVLAISELDAERRALAAQLRGAPYPAERIQVERIQSDYSDLPGVVWQGARGERK